MKTLNNSTILITGATDGIGKATALKLAEMNARLLLHGRNPGKLKEVVNEIQKSTGNDKLEEFVADFSDLQQVKNMADQILGRHEHLDILINNAGIGYSKTREVSKEGYELRLAVNYLAPFLLTHLLLPALKKASPSRIVNVSSAGQHPIDFDDVMLESHYEANRAYSQSKLALIMFTIELAGHLQKENITVNALHPGTYLDTKMVREAGINPLGEAGTGAEAEIYLAASPDLEGVTGKYFDKKKDAQALPQAYDAAARRKLWRWSEAWTGLKEHVSI